jgi:hypothetical protein
MSNDKMLENINTKIEGLISSIKNVAEPPK